MLVQTFLFECQWRRYDSSRFTTTRCTRLPSRAAHSQCSVVIVVLDGALLLLLRRGGGSTLAVEVGRRGVGGGSGLGRDGVDAGRGKAPEVSRSAAGLRASELGGRGGGLLGRGLRRIEERAMTRMRQPRNLSRKMELFCRCIDRFEEPGFFILQRRFVQYHSSMSRAFHFNPAVTDGTRTARCLFRMSGLQHVAFCCALAAHARSHKMPKCHRR